MTQAAAINVGQIIDRRRFGPAVPALISAASMFALKIRLRGVEIAGPAEALISHG